MQGAAEPARGDPSPSHGNAASVAFAVATRIPCSPAGTAPPPEVPPVVHEALRNPGAPLDLATRGLMERRLGHALGHVRVHTDERAAASARAVNALAYTVGHSIVFDQGRYAPQRSDGRALLGHELVHAIQQSGPSAPAGGCLLIDSPDSAAERDARTIAQHIGRGASASTATPARPVHAGRVAPIVARQPAGTAVLGDVRPAAVLVEWSKDKFEISFETSREGGAGQFSFVVRYLGTAKTGGPFVTANTKRIGLTIGDAPLNAKVVKQDATSLSVDLYGDGASVVTLIDRAHLDTRPASRGREHDLSTELDQQVRASSSIWVLDPKATEKDITTSPAEDRPGERPSTTLGTEGSTMFWRIIIDGDGDQEKDLELQLSALDNWPDPVMKDIVKTLQVKCVQLSTGAARIATFDLPKPSSRGSLFPIVHSVTDGRAPTEIDLLVPSGSSTLVIEPGVHGATESRYRMKLDDKTVDYVLPLDPRPQRKVATAEPIVTAGGIVATDIKLGPYGDSFRITIRQLSSGDTTFGITALAGGDPRGTAGAQLKLSGPIRYQLVEVGNTSLGLDLDGDGKADLQIFDQLTTPSDVDGGGPPARARDHRVRVTGSALGGPDRAFDFTYRNGVLTGGFANPRPEDQEAARNAEAVSILRQEATGGGRSEQLDQLEIQASVVRRRAIDAGALRQDTFDAAQALWQVLVQARAENSVAVQPATTLRATNAADAFAIAYERDVGKLSFDQRLAVANLTAAIKTGKWAITLDRYAATMSDLDEVLESRLKSKQGQSATDRTAWRSPGRAARHPPRRDPGRRVLSPG